MWPIRQPPRIRFGRGSAAKLDVPEGCLVVTSRGAARRGWLDYAGLGDCDTFDSVEPNPSMGTAERILSEFGGGISCVVGIGGGSSMDVAKYCAFRAGWRKIMVPTTFGSGSEVTRISVLKVGGKKRSFHDDGIFADEAVVDPAFIDDADMEVVRNSAIDACAQCTEAYDSTIASPYARFMCDAAFEMLEQGILAMDRDRIAMGSLLDGLGFGNASTTLGHALSYVYSNEGVPHGRALAFTTAVAHRFNGSRYAARFSRLVDRLGFEGVRLRQDRGGAADTIMEDRKHLDRNPVPVSRDDVVRLLGEVDGI